jgi:hypothetical protein
MRRDTLQGARGGHVSPTPFYIWSTIGYYGVISTMHKNLRIKNTYIQ